MSQPLFPPSRTQQLTDAHPWMTSDQAHSVVALKLSEFLERYPNNDTQVLLDNFIAIAIASDEHWMRDRVAQAAEWFPI